jgi:hypothetical protein
MGKPIPPASTDPSLSPAPELAFFVLIVFAEKEWPIEIKYVEHLVEQRIIVEDVGRWTICGLLPMAIFTHESMNIREEQSVPLATYYAFANSFGTLKEEVGRRSGIRHARRV